RITVARTAAAGAKRSFKIVGPDLEDCSALEAGVHVLLRHEVPATRGSLLRRPLQRADDRSRSFVTAGLPGNGAGGADRDRVLATGVVVPVVAGRGVECAARGFSR